MKKGVGAVGGCGCKCENCGCRTGSTLQTDENLCPCDCCSSMKMPLLEHQKRRSEDFQTFRLRGLSCMRCISNVKKRIEALDGVKDIEITLKELRVWGQVRMEEVIEAIRTEGYGVWEEDVKVEIPAKSKKIGFMVHGMTCASCVESIEHCVKLMPGVLECTVNLLAEKAEVMYNPDLVSETQIQVRRCFLRS